MIRRALLVVLFFALPAAAESDLRSVFPNRAPVELAGSELQALALSPAVLDQCRGDLADLRLFDASGREIPFLLEQGPALDHRAVLEDSIEAELLGVEQRSVPRRGGADLVTERYRLSPPPAGDWTLVLAESRRGWNRRARLLAASNAGERPLLDGVSLFSLADGRRRLEIQVPAFESDEILILELEGEDSTAIEPGFSYSRTRELDTLRGIELPLELLSMESRDGQTVIELDRPRGLAAEILRIDSTTTIYDRRITVWDEGPGRREQSLAEGRLRRLSSDSSASRLQLLPAGGDRLRLVIDDRDSPPLTGLQVVLELRSPVLLFAPGSANSVELLFGGGRPAAPHYDLEALRPGSGPWTGEAAGEAETLLDLTALPRAILGELGANPRHDSSPALAFAQRPGAQLDARRYGHRANLKIQPSKEGLSHLDLDPELRSLARDDLADLRIVDADGHQWAYLLAPKHHHIWIDLPSKRSYDEGKSKLVPAIGEDGVELDGFEIDAAAPWFDRAYVLRTRREGEQWRDISTGRLRRRLGDPRPLRISFSPIQVDELEIEIDDGDDAPLGASLRLRATVSRLYLAAPAGDYALLLGEPEAEAPRYELERARSMVLSVASAGAELAPLEANPELKRGLRFASQKGIRSMLLWASLLLATGVMAWLILKMGGEGGSGKAED